MPTPATPVDSTALQGEVTIATTTGLAGSLFPVLLRDYRKQHRSVVVRVLDLPFAEISRAVAAGDVDLGLAYGLPDTPEFRTLAAREWQVGVVVPGHHPLAEKQNASLHDCIGNPLILPAPSMSLRAVLETAFAAAGLNITPAFETSSTTLMRRLAALGVGVTFLNPLDVIEESQRGELAFVPLTDAGLKPQTLRLISSQQHSLSPAAQVFADALSEQSVLRAPAARSKR